MDSKLRKKSIVFIIIIFVNTFLELFSIAMVIPVDQNNKEKILNLIKRITRNKTVILVSHDKEVLKICDEVYEIKNKKIYAQK